MDKYDGIRLPETFKKKVQLLKHGSSNNSAVFDPEPLASRKFPLWAKGAEAVFALIQNY